MSLFKAREWWRAVAGEGEQYDQGCMCVGNVDNSQGGGKSRDKIVVGSYHGILRIYNPNPVKTDQGWSNFRPEELMLEQDLGAPILQLSVGLFVSGSTKLHLAVLHPRKLTVFFVSGVTGAVHHGSQYQLTAVYEHKLQRSAFNMCHGPFGQVQGKDFACVQSLDGSLSVFEQERFSFTRFLPGSLLPGPLHYVQQTDSFVTVSSSRHLESYRYQVLAVATDAKTKEESQNIKSGKRVTADWAYLLGEQAVAMQVVNLPGVPLSILVLGKHHIFCLTEYGKLRFSKKLDYPGTFLHGYACVSPPAINYIVSSHSVLLVYGDTALKWTAHIEKTPVHVLVANIDSLRGVVVCLSEDGHVTCCYLGTDPAMMVMPSSQLREINYDEQDAEMKHLQLLIKEKSTTAGPTALSKVKTKDGRTDDGDLLITVQVAAGLDAVSKAIDVGFHEDGSVPSITMRISVRAKASVSGLKTSVVADPSLFAQQLAAAVDDDLQLGPGQEFTTAYTVFKKYEYLPAACAGEVAVAYLNSSGAPRIQRATFVVPTKLVMTAAPPQKTATHKVTIDTNQSPVNLADLFSDITGIEASGSSSTAIGFRFYGCAPTSLVTLLASKTSQRYRLQADDFGAMWLVTNELAERLQKHYKQTGTGCQCSFTGPLPVQEYFETIDTHFEGRVQAFKYKELLEQRASQFRVIQKRMLTRFKDKTPMPLANLDTLLEGTFRQILALADGAEENKRHLLRASNALSCSTHLFTYLMRIATSMSSEDFGVLQSALSHIVIDGDQGWEETTDAALTHLLRTSLSKSSAPKDQAINPSPLSMPEDTAKLKKHVQLLCERVMGRGGRLSSAPAGGGGGGDEMGVGGSQQQQATSGGGPSSGSQQRTQRNRDGSSSTEGDEDAPFVSRFREKRSPRTAAPELSSTAAAAAAGAPAAAAASAASVTARAASTAAPQQQSPPQPSSSLPPLTGAARGRLPSLGDDGAKLSPQARTGAESRTPRKSSRVPDLDALLLGETGSDGAGNPDAIDV